MKQIPQDKYSVAWFTLAECVARGEKVRALGVYRLLAHSIDDKAFRSQLEGDILLAFKDEEAINKYYESACLYQKSGRLLEAAAVYEHIITIASETRAYTAVLVEVYKQMKLPLKAAFHVRSLFGLAMKNADMQNGHDLLQELDSLEPLMATAVLHQQYVYALLNDKQHSVPHILEHIKKTIEGFFMAGDKKALNRFLATLEALEPTYYEQAQAYIAEGHVKE